MKQKSYSQILDHVARDQMAANTDLAPRILARIQKGKSAKMNPRLKVFAAVVVALLVIGILLMNVPAVRAAIQSWFGYVPGIGLVSEGQIRVLAEPVSVTRDGITLSIEHVLVDSTQTTVVYSVDGLAMEMLDNQPNWNSPVVIQTQRCICPRMSFYPPTRLERVGSQATNTKRSILRFHPQ